MGAIQGAVPNCQTTSALSSVGRFRLLSSALSLQVQVSHVVKLAERKRLFEGYHSFEGFEPHARFA